MTRTLWTPHDATDVALPRLPSTFTVRRYDGEVRFEEIGADDVVVAPYSEPVRARQVIRRLRPGSIVQALEAGVEALLPALPSGVTLCSARGVHDAPVAEWTVAAVLSSLKRFAAYRDDQRAQRWLPALGQDLEGRRVLLLGYGSIAKAVERRLIPFGVSIERVASRARDGVHGVEDVAALLPSTDVLIVLTPLTPQTTQLVDGEKLSRLPDGALVVNASRGPVVDTGALLDELQAGRLHAVLDVTDPEPLVPGHPLWDAPNVFITPHVASDTESMLERLYAFVAEQVQRLDDGQPPRNVVKGAY